jgi:anaerobic magnesium-protoporphyrin IX monomethyl ester cyclase
VKVLIVIAPYSYPSPVALRTELLGVLYLGANLRRRGHEVRIYDPTQDAPTKEPGGLYYYGVAPAIMEGVLREFVPDVLGISCHYAYSRPRAYEIFALAKRLNPQVKTVIGGLVTSVYRRSVLAACPEIDFGLIGEAEQSLVDLLDHIAGGAPGTEAIDGLVWRRDGQVVENEKRAFIKDLDALPFPARDLIDTRRAMTTGSRLYGLGNRPALSLLTSRSCPNKCAFCNMWMVHGLGWRPRGVENILGELEEMIGRWGAEHIYIMDDNFTFKPERAKLICEGIIRRGWKIRWNTPNGISVKGIDAELVGLMKRSGCASVCLAIESGSAYIRNEVIRKHVSDEQIASAVGHFHKAKIPVGGFLVLGMPGETEEHFGQTVRLVGRLPLSFIVASYAIPYPGTKLYDMLRADGTLPPGWEVQMDTLSRPVYGTKDFSIEELIRRKKHVLLSFYLRHIPNLLAEFVGGRMYWANLDSAAQLLYNTIRPRGE